MIFSDLLQGYGITNVHNNFQSEVQKNEEQAELFCTNDLLTKADLYRTARPWRAVSKREGLYF